MRRLNKPPYSARSTLELCADNVRNKDLSKRLYSVAEAIEKAEKYYDEQGAKASLFAIAQATNVEGRVMSEEMKTLYTGTLSRKDSNARHIYDAIKSAPKNGICPLCSQRVVSTLDHYLAQSKHPLFAVTPINLVPSCADCNKAKLDFQPTLASEQTLHPYFDDVDDSVWLVATVQESNPPVVVFKADPPATWDDVKIERVSTHFRTFDLGKLYSTHAAEELINIRYSLLRIAERGGPDDIRAYLREKAESCRDAAKNSWQTAMYEALVKSEWFCKEGYNLIAP